MLPDDAFRRKLEETIAELETWAGVTRQAARIDVANAPTYWRMTVEPVAAGAAPFQLLLTDAQRFTLLVAGELYAEKPIDAFEFFPMLVRAIAAGNVERIETSNAMTAALETLETRIVLEDGWAWVGERRIGSRISRRPETVQERRTRRFLPYIRLST